jgi:thioredoxin-related protein
MLSTLLRACKKAFSPALVMTGALFLSSVSVQAEELMLAENLQKLAAEHPNEVIVLMVSADGCSFCITVKNDFLGPLQKSAGAPPIRILDLSSNTPVIDFNGDSHSSTEVAKALKGKFTPTILFVDGKGNHLSKKIVGVNTPEFYGYYIDEAIKESRKALN